MFGAPLRDARASLPFETRAGAPRPGTADSVMSAVSSRGGGAGKRTRLQRLQTKLTLQADLEKKWQLENQHRPITPATLDRLSHQVSRVMDEEFPELASTSAGGVARVVEPLEMESPTRDPALSASRRPATSVSPTRPGAHTLDGTKYDAGPFRPNGKSSRRDQVRHASPHFSLVASPTTQTSQVLGIRVPATGRHVVPAPHVAERLAGAARSAKRSVELVVRLAPFLPPLRQPRKHRLRGLQRLLEQVAGQPYTDDRRGDVSTRRRSTAQDGAGWGHAKRCEAAAAV